MSGEGVMVEPVVGSKSVWHGAGVVQGRVRSCYAVQIGVAWCRGSAGAG